LVLVAVVLVLVAVVLVLVAVVLVLVLWWLRHTLKRWVLS